MPLIVSIGAGVSLGVATHQVAIGCALGLMVGLILSRQGVTHG